MSIKPLVRVHAKSRSPLIRTFHSKGFIFLKEAISPAKALKLKSLFDSSKFLQEESMIFEKGGAARSLFNVHSLQPDRIRSLIKGKWLNLSKKILGKDIYIYQSHVNYKKAGQAGGEFWWHSDWTFWRFEDGMSKPQCLSLVFFLDKANIQSGALRLMPGSHHYTYTDGLARKSKEANVNIRHDYSARTEEEFASEGLVSKKDLKKIKIKPRIMEGNPGDLLIMDANIWHYSPKNKSKKDRNMLFIVINSMKNRPEFVTRPHYLVERQIEKFKL